jgi:hypothetical protein
MTTPCGDPANCASHGECIDYADELKASDHEPDLIDVTTLAGDPEFVPGRCKTCRHPWPCPDAPTPDHTPRTEDTLTLQLLAGDRQTGKTTAAIAWLSWGEQTRTYPGWSRILVVPTLARLDYVRLGWWGRLPDFSHRVYALQEWVNARNPDPSVEVCLDDLDTYLATGLPRIGGHIVAATITAQPWQHVEMYGEH